MNMLSDIGYHLDQEWKTKELKAPEKTIDGVVSRFRDFIELAPLPMAILELGTGRFLDVNDKLCELLECEKSEVIGYTASESGIYAEGDWNRFIDPLIAAKQSSGLEIALKVKGGSTCHILLYSEIIRNEDNFLLVSIFVEIKQRGPIELQRYYKRKLRKTLKTLSGGIAHLINNDLQVIMGNVELILFHRNKHPKSAANLLQIRDSVEKIGNTTQQLLDYSQVRNLFLENISLSKFIREILPDMRDLLKPTIVIKADLPDNIISVTADRRQLKMLITAIVVNASEAIEEAGCIRIVCRSKTISDERVIHGQKIYPGEYAYLMIEDDGQGMNEYTRNKIFEPFFTTKFQGRGLNMAAADGIVRNHGGWITVDSELGQGTRVHVYLPANSLY